VARHVRIPEAQDANAAGLEVSVAIGVVVRGVTTSVFAAVDLDHDAVLGAVEVRDVWTNRLLASKLEPKHLSAAKSLPRLRLCGCRFLPETSR